MSQCQDISAGTQEPRSVMAALGDGTQAVRQATLDSTHDDTHGLFLDPQMASEMPGLGTTGHPMLNAEWSAFLDLPTLRDVPLDFEETILSHTENDNSEDTSHTGIEVDEWSFQTSAIPESDDWINRVLDLQLRLLKLYRVLAIDSEESRTTETSSVSGGSEGLASDTGLSKAIEDIYAATHDFVEVTESLSGLSQDTGRTSMAGGSGSTQTFTTLRDETSTPARAKLPHTSTVLLLSSCYVRLTHIYELLVQALYERCKHNPSTLAPPTQSSTRSDTPNRIPTFRMTHSRLSMPPTASLGMHLVVINHMIQVLKDTMKSCASRNAGATRRVGADFNDGPMSVNDTSPSSVLADLPMSEVSLREQSLRKAVHLAKSLAGI